MATAIPRQQLMFQIQKKRSLLSISQLQTVAHFIKDGEGSSIVSELSEPELYNLIVDFVRSEKLRAIEDEGMSQLLLLHDFLDNLSQVPDASFVNTDGAVTHALLVDQGEPFHTQSSSMDRDIDTATHTRISSKDVCAPAISTPVMSSTAQRPSSSFNNQVMRMTDVASLLPRREFKLHGGQICDAGCDMSFNCLCKQIDEGLQEGFSESEVIRAVLKITKPGTFREMLVNKVDLTIDGLKRILRSHIRDKNVTELFQELTNARQNDKESPQQFLYRIMGLNNGSTCSF